MTDIYLEWAINPNISLLANFSVAFHYTVISFPSFAGLRFYMNGNNQSGGNYLGLGLGYAYGVSYFTLGSAVANTGLRIPIGDFFIEPELEFGVHSGIYYGLGFLPFGNLVVRAGFLL